MIDCGVDGGMSVGCVCCCTHAVLLGFVLIIDHLHCIIIDVLCVYTVRGMVCISVGLRFSYGSVTVELRLSCV